MDVYSFPYFGGVAKIQRIFDGVVIYISTPLFTNYLTKTPAVSLKQPGFYL
ncbi:hypothetical protein HNP24_003832 [Chryseobacterium sediminis]|uniref:Uncharacterized protein n=1 Tax=Chryseobacterium sediminis TaxID=1679494 RepID=A0ABR6Q4Y6_9FLAO|nr:hypothetical protein [Chryseobacterium sediminis]